MFIFLLFFRWSFSFVQFNAASHSISCSSNKTFPVSPSIETCRRMNGQLCEHIHSQCLKNVYFSLSRYQQFKDFQKRILVATNLFGRGMDIERVNIVFNYDMPEDSDTYLHRVCYAHLFTSMIVCLGCTRWSFRHKRSRHHVHIGREWRKSAERCAGSFRRECDWITGRDRSRIIQWVVIRQFPRLIFVYFSVEGRS